MSVLVAATFLLVPARALFFKISPNARECFGVDAKSGDDIVFSFEAIGSDRSVRTSLSFKEQELYSEIKASGNQRITAAEDGQYRLCFKSLLSYVQTISFNVRAQKQETHPEELATLDDSKKLEALVAALEGKVQEISAQQSYATTREAVHRDTSETTNSRILWWTFLEVAVLVVLAGFQIYYLKSFFEVKQLV